jgi:hypothetical protein
VNGKGGKVAFKKLPAHPHLFPAITIYNDKVTCSIIAPKPVPARLLAAMLKLRAKMGLPAVAPVLVQPGDPAAAAAAASS